MTGAYYDINDIGTESFAVVSLKEQIITKCNRKRLNPRS